MPTNVLSRNQLLLFLMTAAWSVLLLPFYTAADMTILNETEMQAMTGAEGVCLSAVQGDCPSYQKQSFPVLSEEEIKQLIEDGLFTLASSKETDFLLSETLNVVYDIALPEDVVTTSPQIIEMPAIGLGTPAPVEIEPIVPELTVPSQPAVDPVISGPTYILGY